MGKDEAMIHHIDKPLSQKRARVLACLMQFGDTAWTTRKSDTEFVVSMTNWRSWGPPLALMEDAQRNRP